MALVRTVFFAVVFLIGVLFGFSLGAVTSVMDPVTVSHDPAQAELSRRYMRLSVGLPAE